MKERKEFVLVNDHIGLQYKKGIILGRKEMFYLTTLSTHFIGVRFLVKGHSDNERGNSLPPRHGYSFSFKYINSQTGQYIVTPVLQNWLERVIVH